MTLYDYLENKYYEEFKEDFNSFEKFVQTWLEENFANDSMYEEFLDGECLGYYYRNFEIDHKGRRIEFSIEKAEL
ncbi:hypothetical protein [Clostridium botulinum]|uniref:Uncharacterized protein n=1 Tax=Clostridium botulinum TaxID=1491 RepID=A0A6B4JND6_CLOBO|nr:hypothetical protein [Clostridium botulinum]EES49892.1 hypothetical protein CLO_1878 [Clostridium botulinum E1 str. 'BoNT E Beluga']MBY6761837.1 hypothetical protein [Clostridium botulinum]MBY6920763.1 hypothetical protein [Clostridium botulinum]MBY6932225.1 hypothetical protein [Clostridium botulinum]MCR1131489.1 hypothetical protein [Clostridium botulinum]